MVDRTPNKLKLFFKKKKTILATSYKTGKKNPK